MWLCENWLDLKLKNDYEDCKGYKCEKKRKEKKENVLVSSYKTAMLVITLHDECSSAMKRMCWMASIWKVTKFCCLTLSIFIMFILSLDNLWYFLQRRFEWYYISQELWFWVQRMLMSVQFTQDVIKFQPVISFQFINIQQKLQQMKFRSRSKAYLYQISLL